MGDHMISTITATAVIGRIACLGKHPRGSAQAEQGSENAVSLRGETQYVLYNPKFLTSRVS